MASATEAANAIVRRRHSAALKAARTSKQRRADLAQRRSNAARKANATRRKPTHKAQKAALRSQDALAAWCKANGWRHVFLDAESGNPRTGIIDAVAVRVKKGAPDTLEVWLIQLKGGRAGLKPAEVSRLKVATRRLEVSARFAFHTGDQVEWTQA